MRVGIVIPTLCRADMLERCLLSIEEHAAEAEVFVVNNWTHSGVASLLERYESNPRVTVVCHPENLGCAGSWNLGLKHFFDAGLDWAVVMNDDATLTQGAVEKLGEAIASGSDLVYSSAAFACFAIHRRATDTIGWFDENLWPAYHEDEDFMHRLRLRTMKVSSEPEARVEHAKSSSLGYSELMWFQHRMKLDQKSLIYYGRKWGGTPNCERFSVPFNDGRNPLSFWPEPGERRMGLKLDERDQVVLDQDRPFSVRVYGPQLGNGSIARVARGLSEGLQELGLLAGQVDMDAFDSQEIHEAPGRGATVGIYTGNPTHVAVTMSGGHDMVFSILAPNSSWLPKRILNNLRDRSAVVSPSSWGADVLAAHGCKRLPPLRHGVARAFSPGDEASRALLRGDYEKGMFRVLHLSSSDRDRKGTRELFTAWQRLVRAKLLGENPLLIAFVDAPRGTYVEAEGDPTIRVRNDRIDASEADMGGVYRAFHLVVQPSRGEGFGMVPIEARACGIPVVATACTGHADHMSPEPWGCVVVPTGEDAAVDDGPGAMAPKLESSSIEGALCLAHEEWLRLFEEAGEAAEGVRNEWSWSNQTATWLDAMGLWRKNYD